MHTEHSKQDLQNKKNKYFDNLFNKIPTENIEKLATHFQNANKRYQKKITQGEYVIKELLIPPRNTEETGNSKQKIKNIQFTKRQLEKSLDQLENKIGKLQQSRQSSQISPEAHQKFIKQIMRQKKEAELRRNQRQRQIQQRQKQIQAQRAQKLQLERMNKSLEKKKELQERVNNIMLNKQRRQSQALIQNKVLDAIRNSQTLHSRLQSQFIHMEALSLQQKKKKLAQIRAMHKPLSKQEFEQHQKKLNELKMKRNQTKQQKNEQKNRSHANSMNSKIYKSMWHKKIDQQITASSEKQMQEQQLQKLRQKRQKQKKYSQYVQQKFKPQIDINKLKQIQEVIQQQKKKNQPKYDESRRIGLQYLKFSKQNINSNRSLTQQNKINEQAPVKKINYLQQLRKNRTTQKEKDIKKVLNNELQGIIKTAKDKQQRNEKIMHHIQRLEEKKKEKQRLNHKGINQQLDQIYINTIKAKLAIIQ